MNIAETICRAISAQRFLEFQCAGETCVVEPHQLGHDLEGAFILRAYPLSDPPALGSPGGPLRRYLISDMTFPLMSSLPFAGQRSGYSRAPNDHVNSAVCKL